MTSVRRDDNGVPVKFGVDSTDGTTIRQISVNSQNRLQISDGTAGSDHGPANAMRDDNSVPALMGVSSVDGVTPVAVYLDSNNKLLVNSQ